MVAITGRCRWRRRSCCSTSRSRARAGRGHAVHRRRANDQVHGDLLLIAESNLVNATRVCDRLYAIDRGEIIFQGNPRDVFANET